jgi:type I restriction-modification system DNA methylase subunit
LHVAAPRRAAPGRDRRHRHQDDRGHLRRRRQQTREDATVADTRRLVDKLWSYCNVLRDDSVGTIEYTEQLTYLLFLKMAHERETRALNPERIVPAHLSWQRLPDADGDEVETTYRHILEELGRRPGVLGTIFRKAQNRIQDPAKLKRLVVDLIDRESWSAMGTDVKVDAYEELLSKGAEDIKSGAGQYFTPRPLIAAMNLILHGMGKPTGESPIEVRDARIALPARRWSVVLSNPPFGRKSSLTMVGADGHLLRAGRQGQRAVLRQAPRRGAALDRAAVGL